MHEKLWQGNVASHLLQEELEECRQQLQGAETGHKREIEQLTSAYESRLEQLTSSYEFRLEEHRHQLQQCKDKARQQKMEYELMMKMTAEDGDKEIMAIRCKYEAKLKILRDLNAQYKDEAWIMKERVERLEENNSKKKNKEIEKLEAEVKKNLNIISNLENDVLGLKQQIMLRNENIEEKEILISEMRERNTGLQSMKFILDNRVKELTTQIDPKEEIIKELKEQIGKMEEELIESSEQNSWKERSIADLKLKLNAKDKDMRKKMERACDTSTVVKRFKADLLSCVGFIQDPKRLKESVLQMHARYIRQSDEDLLRQDLGKLRHGREEVDVARNMVKSLQRKLAKETEFHSTQRFKLIQENSTLIKELNDFIRALKDSQDKVHDYENQLSVYRRKKPSNSSGTKGPGSTSSPRGPHSLATNLTRKEVAQRLIPWQRA
ncbi:cilia- and flagella-associated protein 57-like isoform X3 [Conger conger]|nr:cilia- and flagella-associated protein 57-like isoform X3 [Conger conger]